MKKIFKIVISFAIALTIFSSCNEEANLPTPDGLKTTDLVVSIYMNAASDGNINVFDFADFQGALDVNVVVGDFSSVELMFSINNDFANQYKLADITTFPSQTVEYDVFDLIASSDLLSDTTDIAPGDVFTFYINFTSAAGDMYYGYHPLTGKLTQSPAQGNIDGQAFNVNLLAACPYIPNFFEGLYDVHETDPDGGESDYQSTVSINPEYPDSGLICTDIWWPSDAFASATLVYIDLDTYETHGYDQIIWGGDAYSGLGRIGVSDFTPGLANTCDYSFWFTATPDLPDSGYWWGGPAKWEMTPAAAPAAEKSERVVKSIDYVTRY